MIKWLRHLFVKSLKWIFEQPFKSCCASSLFLIQAFYVKANSLALLHWLKGQWRLRVSASKKQGVNSCKATFWSLSDLTCASRSNSGNIPLKESWTPALSFNRETALTVWRLNVLKGLLYIAERSAGVCGRLCLPLCLPLQRLSCPSYQPPFHQPTPAAPFRRRGPVGEPD